MASRLIRLRQCSLTCTKLLYWPVHLEGSSAYIRILPLISPVTNWKVFSRYGVPLNVVSRAAFRTSAYSRGEVVQFHLADIGEGIAEVQITEWYVKVGSKVEQFDQICEVKSDKASVTITSRYKGTIRKLYYNVDDEAKVGSPIVDIEVEGAESKSIGKQVVAEPEPVLKEEATRETLPPPPRHPSTAAVKEQAQFSPAGSCTQTRWPATPVKDDASKGRDGSRKIVPATPAVRKIAMENKIDLASVVATGRDGRVLKEDVLHYIASKAQARPPEIAVPVSPPPLSRPAPLVQAGAEDRIEQIKGVRKAMVNSMVAALQIPQANYCDEVEMTELVRLRKFLKDLCKERGQTLSFMPFFIKAASMAMVQYPIINSSFNLEKMELIYKASHNIGFAMDTKEGLLVPNVKNVQRKSLFEIASDMNRLGELGAKGKLGLDDITGGSFTISNIGSIGGTYVQAVVNPPEVAICGLGKIQTLPRFNIKGEVIAGNIMNVSWSIDHRIIDGATIARFSNLWKSYLENPSSMILDLK